MSAKAIRRLAKEKEEMDKEKSPYFNASPIGDNLFEWSGYIMGPEDSVYEGFKYNILITFPTDFPFSPPVIKFTTPIYHANVAVTDGTICHQVLKDKWSPALLITKVLLTLYDMMATPNPESALNHDAAMLLQTDKAAMRAKVESMFGINAAPAPAPAPA